MFRLGLSVAGCERAGTIPPTQSVVLDVAPRTRRSHLNSLSQMPKLCLIVTVAVARRVPTAQAEENCWTRTGSLPLWHVLCRLRRGGRGAFLVARQRQVLNLYGRMPSLADRA